jgi:hypothetical protein
MSPTIEPDISRAAAQAFRQRQAKARELVRSGLMDARRATDHLRPWLAIACLVGADLPELEDGLCGRRVVQIWPNDARKDVTEAEARGLLADEICPRRLWAPVLAKARDDALHGPLETPEQCAAAVALADLARHLRFDPNGRHDVPPPAITVPCTEKEAA